MGQLRVDYPGINRVIDAECEKLSKSFSGDPQTDREKLKEACNQHYQARHDSLSQYRRTIDADLILQHNRSEYNREVGRNMQEFQKLASEWTNLDEVFGKYESEIDLKIETARGKH